MSTPFVPAVRGLLGSGGGPLYKDGMSELFRGPLSLTYRGERIAFYLTLLFALPAAGAIGYVLREDARPSQVAVLLVIAMIYVTLARGRLVGSSVRIHE